MFGALLFDVVFIQFNLVCSSFVLLLQLFEVIFHVVDGQFLENVLTHEHAEGEDV